MSLLLLLRPNHYSSAWMGAESFADSKRKKVEPEVLSMSAYNLPTVSDGNITISRGISFDDFEMEEAALILMMMD